MGRAWTFLILIWAEWASRVTGSFSAFLVLLGIGISIAGAFGVNIPATSILQLATWLLAALCGLYAAFSVWKRERIVKEALEAQLAPRLIAIFDPKKPPCRDEVEFRYSDGRNPEKAMAYRIEVENIGAETINDCDGYLTEVAFEGEGAELGVFNLFWSGIYPLALKVDLKPNVPRHLDLIAIFETGAINITSPGWPPNNRENFFSRHGHYRFTVVVGGEKTTLPPYKLCLNYTGDWKTSTMEVMVQRS